MNRINRLYSQRTVLILWFPNLPTEDCWLRVQPGDCVSEMQPVFMVFKPTSRRLLARGSACLLGFRTYLRRTVGHGCSMFKQFSNLPPGDCRPGVQQVYAVSEQSYWGLLVRDAVSLYGFWTDLGMCFIATAVFILAIYNASKPCFGPFVSDICNSNCILEPPSRGLLARGATCLYGFPTFRGLLPGCSLFKRPV